ncbi:DUF2786 domain-containing protein [Actinoplanes sp. CA-054009]
MTDQPNSTGDASEKTLAKIRALLAKAEDQAATPAEAEAYTAKATQLMAQYGIDRAILADSDPTSDVVGDRVIVIYGPYAIDKQHLCSYVAMALGCRTILRTRYVAGQKQLSVHLFGFGVDLDRAEILFTSLLVQALNGMAKARPYGNVAAFRRSWLQGFAHTVSQRLIAAERSAQTNAEQARQQTASAAGRSVALVLADRSALVVARVDEAYPKVKKAKTRQLSGDGYYDGAAAGERADLGGTRIGRTARAAVGAR